MILHEELRKWAVQSKGWAELNPLQSTALKHFGPNRSFLVEAGTASGKTEAAFLPALTDLLSRESGIIICVTPLRALIDDLVMRVEDMLDRINSREENPLIPVIAWHGEGASSALKQKALDSPRSVIIITPESLETLVRRYENMQHRYDSHPLKAKVISSLIFDEFHTLLDSYRGLQVKGLIGRLRFSLGLTIKTGIALSATLADRDEACSFLEQILDYPVYSLVGGNSSKMNVSLLNVTLDEKGMQSLYAQLFTFDKCLVFPPSKVLVEKIALELEAYKAKHNLSHLIVIHHASLSAHIKENTIQTIRENDKVITVCTSTLELGVDLPAVDVVAQVGLAPSAQALRQRAGRSGRSSQSTGPSLIYATPLDYFKLRHGALKGLDLSPLICELQAKMAQEGIFEKTSPLPQYSLLAFQLAGMFAMRGSLTPHSISFLRDKAYSEVIPSEFQAILNHWVSMNYIAQYPDEGEYRLRNDLATLMEAWDSFSVFEIQGGVSVESDKGEPLGSVEVPKGEMFSRIYALGGRAWQCIKYDQKAATMIVSLYKGVVTEGFAGSSANRGFGLQVSKTMGTVLRQLLREHSPILPTSYVQSTESVSVLEQLQRPSDAHDLFLLTSSVVHHTVSAVYNYVLDGDPDSQVFPSPVGVHCEGGLLEDPKLRAQVLQILKNPEPFTETVRSASGATKWSSKLLPTELIRKEHILINYDFEAAREALASFRR